MAPQCTASTSSLMWASCDVNKENIDSFVDRSTKLLRGLFLFYTNKDKSQYLL